MFFVFRVVVVQITSQISERGFSMVIAGVVSAQRLSIEIRLWRSHTDFVKHRCMNCRRPEWKNFVVLLHQQMWMQCFRFVV